MLKYNRLLLIILLVAIPLTSLAVTENPHGNLSLSCTDCHTTDSWNQLKQNMIFDHNSTGFNIDGRHNSLGCTECHTSLLFNSVSSTCNSCHIDIHENQFGNECEQCHTPQGWIDYTFFRLMHSQTEFPLTGVHANVDCQMCHSDGVYKYTPLNCSGCHLETYESTNNPDHAAVGFSTDCLLCHQISTNNWEGASFSHTQSFKLEGGHNNVECQSCHTTSYVNTSSECFSCHNDDYNNIDDPDHAGSLFPTTCEDCHTIFSWEPADYDHNLSQFALEGAHRNLDCGLCHGDGSYTGTTQDCFDCHEAHYSMVQDPDHNAGQYEHECLICHNMDGWIPSGINDHSRSGFVISGAHLELDCSECHSAGYNGTPNECYPCHQQDYEATEDPDHVNGNFPQDCLICHNDNDWENITFDHDLTDFPLIGAHVSVDCNMCHSEGYTGTATDCYSCHQEDYADTDDPDHVAENYSHECLICHNQFDWDEVSINHDMTAFPLLGAHQSVDCNVCHTNGYSGTPSECYGCHQENYDNTTDPDHIDNNYPHDCEVCHGQAAWTPAEFNHDLTDFPLIGAHQSVDCATCHTDGYTGTPSACYACHQENFEGVADPDHVGGNYPHECEVCHGQSAWSPAEFDHDDTQFPLTGAHTEINCNLCHSEGYTNTPTSCFACHEENYDGTSNPRHSSAQFDTDCSICHTTTAWLPADWSHNSTEWPLTGAHIGTSCINCHVNEQYENTPTDCYFCHQVDYNSANDPDHSGAGFPTDCTDCHTTTAWEPATFNHIQWFPIYSGEHRNEWDSCQDCHPNSSNFQVFTCIDCHEHNRADMDDEHDDVSGYVYSSDACYDCHPNGEADDKMLVPLKKTIDTNINRD